MNKEAQELRIKIEALNQRLALSPEQRAVTLCMDIVSATWDATNNSIPESDEYYEAHADWLRATIEFKKAYNNWMQSPDFRQRSDLIMQLSNVDYNRGE